MLTGELALELSFEKFRTFDEQGNWLAGTGIKPGEPDTVDRDKAERDSQTGTRQK